MTTQDMNNNQLKIIERLMTMQDKNSNFFEIINGEVILHDKIRGVDKVVINHEQVGAIKLLFEAIKNGEI